MENKKSAKKAYGEYYLGLDIGTDSIGYAVTDLNYNLLKFNGKSMWGIRLFDSGKTAEERRMYRTSRRRTARRKERRDLLQGLFAEEIAKVDNDFFLRLNSSRYYPEDKINLGRYSIFNDADYTDKDYHRNYPTIYHLRKSLIENRTPHDVRLVYLALANIIKHRGHFLFEGQNFETEYTFKQVFENMNNCLYDEFGFTLDYDNIDEIETILKEKGINNKKKKLLNIYGKDDSIKKSIIELLCGASVAVSKIFDFEDDSDAIKISFTGDKFETEYENLEKTLNEKIRIIEAVKAVYDWSVLADILNGENYISNAKVKIYEKHKQDLKLLKKTVKKYCSHDNYSEIFNDPTLKANYPAYVQISEKNSKKQHIEKNACLNEDLCKFISKYVNDMPKDDPDVAYICDQIANGAFLPKQINKDNGIIPYQIHLKELKQILTNASEYLPFLNEKDEDGYSVSEKIEKIMTFRIPYYVGPLNDANKDSGFCWIAKKSNEKILPWTFDRIVDKTESAERFIKRMTNKCTYLPDKDVIPKNSLLYSKFMLLNELNNIKVNGTDISVELKKKLYEELFMTKAKVTAKNLKEFLSSYYGNAEISISGIDGEIKASLKSYMDLKKIMGNGFDEKIAEEIISSVVLLGNDKKMLKKRVKAFAPHLSEEAVNKITKLSYSGWSRLSKEFLVDVEGIDKTTGEYYENIITALWETNNNLMQLLSSDFTFSDAVAEHNKPLAKPHKYTYDSLVKDLYASPAVKRSIWQVLCIIKELRKIIGHAPQKVFIEVTRSDEEKGEKGRKLSRRQQLIDLYKKCRDDERNWAEELSNLTDDDLRRDRLYLYYTQMGKCMYSGQNIDLHSLYDTNIYDIDHIYPQSVTKDDSINNRVLVLKTYNAKKSDRLVPEEMRQTALWKMLYSKGLIEKAKYDRLNRTQEFSPGELGGFIARQLVETNQSTKAVAEILKQIFPADETEIVYSKAKNVTDFRKGVKCFPEDSNPSENAFLKVREINDYHHAKDAYLNIVVGNVYNTKFTHSPANYIKDHPQIHYNLKRMYEFDVKRDNSTAWLAGKNGTMKTVKKVMSKNDIRFTRYAYENKGGLFDQNPVKGKEGLMPLKGNDPILADTVKYGGYDKVSGAYFCLVEHLAKKKRVRTIEFIPVYLSKEIEKQPSVLADYLENKAGLTDIKILIPKIKINSLFSVDGFLMHLSGRTVDRLIFKGACQLIMDDEMTAYFKKIVKFEGKCTAKKQTLEAAPFDKLSKEENIKVYEFFLNKLKNSVYGKRLSAQVKTFEKGYDKFITLTEGEQSRFLYNAVNMFRCNPQSADLSLIGGPKNAGILVLRNDVTKQKSIKIIYQSSTGLFEKVTDLSAL